MFPQSLRHFFADYIQGDSTFWVPAQLFGAALQLGNIGFAEIRVDFIGQDLKQFVLFARR